jgi:LDH2 family malate/lactate/ureidoglycolate dehydrogenase
VRVDWEALRSFCEEVLSAAGVPHNEARIVAASLVDADLLAAAERYGVSPETLDSGSISREETQR